MYRAVILCILVFQLIGCSTAINSQKNADHPLENQGLLLEQEVAALLAQPYIDPITRYLQLHQQDASRARYLQALRDERINRCQKVASSYQQQPKTVQMLQRFQAGYRFSCPDEVEDFARQLTVAEYGDCYLLTNLRNYSAALVPCEQAAAKGDPRGQLNMAIISNAQRNYPKARYWAEVAAESLPEAHWVLGELHANGHLGEKDLTAARLSYQFAAEHGLAQAQIALGLLLINNAGGDLPQARAWLLKAARQENATAQYYLGDMSEKGLAGPADLYEAMVWYDFANMRGSNQARIRLLHLSQQAIDLKLLSLAKDKVLRQLEHAD
ncbi:hypothetical protein GCM10010919_33760 [Alishewanella longhuensis]|uniref:Sel1 repeat family protein n=1 Tax=Alishewanella longhuensis TaxID=1091037 RepID=A0ABQ3L6M7_9ALTE|nr:tetratricopeptide repeat protein [Alishewanella longhuensis]GHG77824.1 hypothetical protein GCM10010919_33760 [Alishewanella longhuensis]